MLLLNIRLANQTDLCELLKIEQDAFPKEKYDRFHKKQYHYLLTKANAAIWIAIANGKSCASAIVLFRKNANYGRLYSIAVKTETQGLSIGTQLLNHIEEKIKKKGLLEIRQEVREDNYKLINHYKKIGYLPYGRSSNYYPDGVACIKLKKVFIDE